MRLLESLPSRESGMSDRTTAGRAEHITPSLEGRGPDGAAMFLYRS